MQPLPNLLAKLVSKDGLIQSPWNSYLQQFTQQPPRLMPIIVGISPFEYTALEPGTIYISGGTLTGVTFTRGPDSLTLGTAARIIPVAIQDTVRIAYSVLPTIAFVPSYGQRTG